MNDVSVVILTKNSSTSLEGTLSSVKGCREIIIVDDYSEDTTLKIAKKYKAKVFRKHLNGNFASQRNFGLSKARGKWVLFLDSDETISKLNIPDGFDGFYIQRKDFWLGRQMHFGENNVRLLRLAKKGYGRWSRKVHEHWDIKGKVGTLKDAVITHYPHPTLRNFIEEISVYSKIHYRENKKLRKTASMLKVLFMPFAKFINNFVLKSGFRDGTRGFIVAAVMSLHSFLSWSQLWLDSRRKY